MKAVSLGKIAEHVGPSSSPLSHYSTITLSTPLWGKEMLLGPFIGEEETFGSCGCDHDCTEVLEKLKSMTPSTHQVHVPSLR